MANQMLKLKGFRKLLLAAVATVAACSIVPSANAALLVDFKPEPSPPGESEIVFSGSALTAGPGATGNNDVGTAGGLRIETPYIVPTSGIGGTINTAEGTTTFPDVSLVLNSLVAVGPASPTTIAPGVVLLTQPLDGSNGSFTLRSTGAPGAQQDLLVGRITRAFITGIQGATTGSVLSAEVEYTDGAIFDALVAAGGQTTGSLSFSLNEIGSNGSLSGLQISTTSGGLAPFQANATGIFSTAIPEPGTVALLGIGGLILSARRRK